MREEELEKMTKKKSKLTVIREISIRAITCTMMTVLNTAISIYEHYYIYNDIYDSY